MPAASKVRCPKCRLVGMRWFEEIWPVASSRLLFEFIDGERIAHGGAVPEVDPKGVEAVCECGHRWRLRGVIQITEITAD